MASKTPCAEEKKPFLFAYHAPTAFQIHFCLTITSEINQFAQEALAQIQATGNQGNINTQESLAQLGEVSETLSTIYQHDINQIEEIIKQSAVVRTNWASHVILRYSLSVGDIYGIGRFSVSCILV